MFRKKPPLEKCRPCDDGHYGECEGPERCSCMICNQIKPVVEDMQRDWAQREKSWPT